LAIRRKSRFPFDILPARFSALFLKGVPGISTADLTGKRK
jgi:hypothetical protein